MTPSPKRKRVPCPTCKLDMNGTAKDKPNPCPQCGQGRGKPWRERGIAVTLSREHWPNDLSLLPKTTDREDYHWLRSAGLKPMKPGETRKVRLIIGEIEP